MRKLNDNLWSTPFQIPLMDRRCPFSWVSCWAHVPRFVYRSRNAITQPVPWPSRSSRSSWSARISPNIPISPISAILQGPEPLVCLFSLRIYWLIIFISNGIPWKPQSSPSSPLIRVKVSWGYVMAILNSSIFPINWHQIDAKDDLPKC